MDETASPRALSESEELHRITLAAMSDAVFITDDDGVFTYICPNADVIFGYGEDEIRAMGRIARLLGRELIARGQPLANGEVQNIEQEIVTKAGARRTVLVHIKQVAIKGGTRLYVCRDITERRQSELALRRHEQRLALALEAASMGTWDWQVATGEMTWSPETHRIFGDLTAVRPPSFEAFLDRLHPVDRDRVSRVMNDAMDRATSYETEFRIIGYDKVERWVFGKGRALRNGVPLRMLGVFVDFTERYRAERDLRELGGRLIQAQEQERGRLARDLRGVGQRIADLAPVSSQVASIERELYRLSSELQPAILEQSGLAGAVRALCQETADAHHLDIRVEIEPIPKVLPADVALSLYRVTQEALRNTVRHSGATRVIVTVSAAGHDLLLSIVDGGTGFDEAAARRKNTIGLVSMRERMRIVRGQLIVTSKIGGGTRVEARVPLQAG